MSAVRNSTKIAPGAARGLNAAQREMRLAQRHSPPTLAQRAGRWAVADDRRLCSLGLPARIAGSLNEDTISTWQSRLPKGIRLLGVKQDDVLNRFAIAPVRKNS